MSLNVLVYGNGAREEAICDAISKSPLLNKIYREDNPDIDLAIFGPEKPICDGLADEFRARGVKCIAVNKDFSRLESSKLFAKRFMAKNRIKTAKITTGKTFPTVIKADGLCGGKGVKIAYNQQEAELALRHLKRDFDQTIFFEEFLQGDEISVMSLFDGKNILHFAPARDFKKLSADKNAPNTGGMGAYCPVKLTTEQSEKLDAYSDKLHKALLSENADFTGFIYSGLIWTRDDWYVLEYNVRLGDPETQAILNHLKTDFLTILDLATQQRLDEIVLEYHDEMSACLTVAAEGYPHKPKIGYEINFEPSDDVKVYYAGVKEVDGRLYSNGGRVLSLCAGDFQTLREFADKIKMKHKYFRKDIDISK